MISRERRLYRSTDDKKIGGVAAGLAEYLGVSVILTRIVLILLLFVGFGFPLYILFWILTPRDPGDGFVERSPSRFPMLITVAGAVIVGGIVIAETVGTDEAILASIFGLIAGMFFLFRSRRLDDDDAQATAGREYRSGFSITPNRSDDLHVRVVDMNVGIDQGRIAGVCARVGAAIGMDPTIVRVLTVILIPVTFPLVPILYAVAALVMPKSSRRISG